MKDRFSNYREYNRKSRPFLIHSFQSKIAGHCSPGPKGTLLGSRDIKKFEKKILEEVTLRNRRPYKEFFIFDKTWNDYEKRKNKIEEGGKKKKREFNEEYHVGGRPEWIAKLFKKIDSYCLTNIKTGIKRTYLQTYIRYTRSGKMFCYVIIRKEALRIYLKLKYSELENPPVFIRDYSKIARQTWIELLFDNEEQYLQNEMAMLDVTYALIDKSFKRITEKPKLARKIVTNPKVEPITKLEPVATIKNLKMNLTLEIDGYVSLVLKIPRNQLNKTLDRILG